MNNTTQSTIFSRLARFAIQPFSTLTAKHKKKQQKFVPALAEIKKLPNPALVLPEGILPIPTFKNLVQEELAFIQAHQHQSFLLQLQLNEKNCNFLTETARKILALDCLKLLQKNKLGEVELAFSPTGKLWLLFSNADEQVAITKAKTVFNLVRKLLRTELDVQLPLVELNMFKVGGPMPVIE